MSIQLRYAARSDVGLVRSNNQDSAYAGSHLLVLADGMGGPAGGDIASSVVLAHLAPLDADSHGADDLLALLRDAVAGAHRELQERSSADEALAGLGTTCIAMLRSGNKIGMVHIGDSRAYLLRDDELVQVTRDHSFVQYLVDTGQLHPEAAENHPQRSVLLRVLGDSAGEVALDESVRAAVVGDRWLLCSDGLSGVVSQAILQEVLLSEPDPDTCADLLVELALKGGGPDNITCIVADVVDTSAELPSSAPQVVGAASTDRGRASRYGDSPAQKAASLPGGRLAGDVGGRDGHGGRGASGDGDDISEAASARPWWKRLLGLFVALALFAALFAGSSAFYSWSQQHYFLGFDHDFVGEKVVVYRGIAQSLGSLRFYEVIDGDTGYDRSNLSPLQRTLVENHTLYDSASAAREGLSAGKQAGKQASTSPGPRPTTSPAAPPAPGPATSPAASESKT